MSVHVQSYPVELCDSTEAHPKQSQATQGTEHALFFFFSQITRPLFKIKKRTEGMTDICVPDPTEEPTVMHIKFPLSLMVFGGCEQ